MAIIQHRRSLYDVGKASNQPSVLGRYTLRHAEIPKNKCIGRAKFSVHSFLLLILSEPVWRRQRYSNVCQSRHCCPSAVLSLRFSHLWLRCSRSAITRACPCILRKLFLLRANV